MVEIDCSVARESLSARIDGEHGPLAPERVEAHLAGCPQCQEWHSAAMELRKRSRLMIMPGMPGSSVNIVDALDAAPRPRRIAAWWPRIALTVLALAQITLALSTLSHHHGHSSHEVTVLKIALAVGFLAAAIQPSRARGMVALMGVASLGLLVSAAIGLLGATTTITGELGHLTVIAGWAMLMVLARRHTHDGPLVPRSARTTPPSALAATEGRAERASGASRESARAA